MPHPWHQEPAMPEDRAKGVPFLVPALAPAPAPEPGPAAGSAIPREIPAPDPAVVESARSRLATRYSEASRQLPVQLPAMPVQDIRAIIAVTRAVDESAGQASASQASASQASALDIAAGLVLLCDLRQYLYRLEADLLDRAGHAGLIVDAIAATMGIPAAAVRRRHAALRVRRDSVSGSGHG